MQRLAQKASGFLWGYGVDERAAAPFKAGDLDQLGQNLDVPMIMVGFVISQGIRMDIVIEWRIVERPVETVERLSETTRQL